MRKLFLFVVFLMGILNLSAQKKEVNCGSDDLHLKSLKEDSEYKKRFDKNTAEWQQYAPKHLNDWQQPTKKNGSNETPPITPPPVTLSVVIHDMSATNTFLLPSTGTVSDYQYIIDKLNLIYDGTNLNGVPGNNTYINFCLAKKNQYGDTYTFSASRNLNVPSAANLDRSVPSQINALVSASFATNTFTQTKYINVYVVDNIVGAAGFATLPSSHGSTKDGIYISRNYLMNNASLNLNMNVLAHEMGHYLGLFHTFGICDPTIIGTLTDPVTGYNACSCDNSNCLFNGDMVCDTAPNMLQMSGYTATTFPNTCHTDASYTFSDGSPNNPTTDINDPKDNFMDYGISNFQNKFSLGQITRMHFMVDPGVGPRKTLLGQAVCVNCDVMNYCAFSIVPNVTLPGIRHEITQVSGLTPAVQFNPGGGCTTSLGSQLNYTWTLVQLGTTDVTLFQNVLSANYVTTPGLSVGNYQLTMTATLASNNQCFETVVYNFCILPVAGTCALLVPNGSGLSDWGSANWQRTSFTNGWVYNGTSYPSGSQHFDATQSGFDSSGFDVLSIAPGGAVAGDANFTGVSLPMAANISKIMRVGKISGGGGKAYYAKQTITINRNNCKFRVWYLGATQGLSLNTAFPFFNNTSNNDAAFGVMSKYRYNSPVNTISSTYNTTIGCDDLGGANDFRLNTLVSQLLNSTSTDFVTSGGYNKMTNWKSVDLDYSEFVDLANDTEITLTFFSHSNIAASSLQEAYAYYGIECLGGGTPTHLSLDLLDQSLPCSSPSEPSCFVYSIPRLSYDSSSINNPNFNFNNVTVYKINQLTGLPSTSPYPITILGTSLTICLSSTDAPFQDFQIVYKTMHETIVDTFRLYVGFYNNLPDCTTGDAVDTGYHSGIINGDLFLCGTENLPELHLTDTCVTLPVTYQWYLDGTSPNKIIVGATGATLQLTYLPPPALFSDAINGYATVATFNYTPTMCHTYYRKAIYKEPYCENPKEKVSEPFHVYNKETLWLKYSNTLDNDICFGDTYTMQVVSPSLSVGNCTIPSHFDTNFTNHLTFQLYDPASNQPIGNAIPYVFTGQIINDLSSSLALSFTFNNINPSTGNTPLFVPTSTVFSFPISIRITGDYLGCPIDPYLHTYPIQYINFNQSAIGGTIVYDCNDLSISSLDNGITFGGYGWEYSIDGTNFNPIAGAPLTTSLPNSFFVGLAGSNPTLYIRRKSNGTGNCLAPSYSNVVVLSNHPSTVIFSLPATVCSGSSPITLPTTSTNGIIGTWNVAAANTNASATYVFTPASGYCLPPYSYSLTIVNDIVATFAAIPPICVGGSITLPTTSTNGIVGTWSPAVTTSATTTYTFHPNSGQCSATDVTLTVVVNASGLVPVFNLPTAVCGGMGTPVLPTTSFNGVVGHWSPTVISNSQSGVYVFTPNANQCATTVSVSITVIPNCDISLSWGSEVSCQLATEPEHGIKDYNADIVDGPCIRVCENSTITYTLAGGGIGAISSTEWHVTGGTIQSSTDTTCTIVWGVSSFSVLQGLIHLNNGTTLEINKCIEKLIPPQANFGIRPNFETLTYTGCVDNPINFENLTTNNSGNDVLYYNWFFGDGTTSNEFEPSHVYTHTGTYTVTLVVYNGCSCASRYDVQIIIAKTRFTIACASVACEGTQSSYSVESSLGDDCPNLSWNVTGGHIVGHNANNSQINVLWDAVDADGFGYISISSPTCSRCVSQIKIPVVKQHGTIVGSDTMCPKSQNTYSLPQWPSTDFQWSLNDGGTGAVLITNNNRNEIIVKSQTNGTLVLSCTYFNTLLGCGGSAQYTIHVRPFAQLTAPYTVCKDVVTSYEVLDETGALISNVNWVIEGPDGFVTTGTTGSFQIGFPLLGTYTFTINDVAYCSGLTRIVVKESPVAPSAIVGPLVVCPGVPVSYSCAPQANTVTHWQVVGGSLLGSSTGDHITVNFDALPTTLTSYTVKVWYEGALCSSSVYEMTIQRDVPVFDILSNTITVCGSSNENYSTAYTSGENYVWSVVPETAGSVESGQNTTAASILWNQSPGTAYVKLQVRKCGVVYERLYEVTIIDHPIVTIVANSPLCSNLYFGASFSMSVGTSFDYATWNFGDGTVLTVPYPTTSVSHLYTSSASPSVGYNVTVTVHGGNGCLSDSVADFPLIVSSAPIIDLNYPDLINLCGYEGSGSPLFECSVNIQSGFSQTNLVQWYKDGVLIPSVYGGTNAVINVSSDMVHFGAGVYYATVTNDNNCTSTTALFTIYDDCDGDPTTGGPITTGGCNCTYDLDVTYPCQSVTASLSNTSCGLISTSWDYTPHVASAVVTQYSNTNYTLTNLIPGKYSMIAYMTYNLGGGTTCNSARRTNFIVPYAADLRYQVECLTGGSYTVTLLDHSVYYPQVGISKYEYSTDGGSTWHDEGTAVQYVTTLSSGTYTLGVRISTPGYTACIAYVTLELPAAPNAHFTFGNNACQGSAMQFVSDDHSSGLQYLWSFPDDVTNLQQDPVRTFNGSGPFLVVLTVTNQYGCSATWGTQVNVRPVKLRGEIVINPTTACEGSAILMTYQPEILTSQIMPSTFEWYYNEVTSSPFATTTVPTLNVTQSGQYFVYVQDINGCYEYENPPVSVGFIPPPSPPVITGSSVVCAGSSIKLAVPNDTTLHYVWSLNGVVQSGWNDLIAVDDVQTSVGTYTYSVVSQVVNPAGGYCSSTPSTFQVSVVAEPNVPELVLDVLSCTPYEVMVTVANPQSGVNYYWSNGFTGTQTTLTHDGPIEVRAEVFDCSVTSQIDLPRDLTALAWQFPKGCYVVCTKQLSGYIVNPLGPFETWSWLSDAVVVSSGSGTIPDFDQLVPGHSYSLQLDNGYCHTLFSSVSISESECSNCHAEYVVKDVTCISVNGVNLYSVSLETFNANPDPLLISLSVPGGEGYFDTNSFLLPNGLSVHTLQFHTLNGFQGGTVPVSIVGYVDEKPCYSQLDVEFPDLCTEVNECKFGYKVQPVRCVSTPHGAIYQVAIEVTNPYGFPASMVITAPNGEGYFDPSSIIAQAGTHVYTFNLFPLNGFNGGAVAVTLDGSFTDFHCIKDFTITCPQLCTPAPLCDFQYSISDPVCEALGNNAFVYHMNLSITNSLGSPATVTLSVPNGQGYLVPTILQVPIGTSTYAFDFNPFGTFYGGNVVIGLLAQWKDKVCYTEKKIRFQSCCIFCKVVDLEDPIVLSKNLLVVAPNPAGSSTTIYYNFVNSASQKQLSLVDLLGRTLQEWVPDGTKGTIELDCTRYASGQYVLLMREDGKIIENAKLITN